MPPAVELGAAKGVSDHLGNRRTGMHFGAMPGHRPEHADGIHALVRLFQTVGALHLPPAEATTASPSGSGGGQPGDQVGLRPGVTSAPPRPCRSGGRPPPPQNRVGLMPHHHRFNRWRPPAGRTPGRSWRGMPTCLRRPAALEFSPPNRRHIASHCLFSCAMVPPPKETIAGVSPQRNESRDPNPLGRGWRAKKSTSCGN